MQEIDNFLSLDDCNEIIKLCENLNMKSIVSDNSYVFSNQYRIKFSNKELQMKIQKALPNKFTVCESFSYVKYENNGFMPYHVDSYSEQAIYSCIIYLNDDYKNGETFIVENYTELAIEKKIGKCFIFKGSKIMHGCYKVGGTKKILICKLF